MAGRGGAAPLHFSLFYFILFYLALGFIFFWTDIYRLSLVLACPCLRPARLDTQVVQMYCIRLAVVLLCYWSQPVYSCETLEPHWFLQIEV